ncbi:Ig-like domain-containing protein [Agathobacter sp.]
MRIKKTLAMLLASTLIVTSTGIMPVSAADSAQGDEMTPATGQTNISLNIAQLNDDQGNSSKPATGSTGLTLNIKELEANQGNANKNASASTKLTLVIADHEWSEPTYTWSADNKECTATRTCSVHEGEAAETETVKTTSEVTKEATCDADGEVTYTAEFTKDGFKTQTKKGKISAIGHKYGEPEITWDGYNATAIRTCPADDHTEELECTVTSEVTTEAACETTGVRTYTATVNVDGKEYKSTKEAEIPATGHTIVTDAAKAPTCTATGLTEGSHCSVCNEVIKAQEVIPATGHDYGKPSFTWSDNNSKATATFTCANDSTHVENVECKVTSETVAPTCDNGGKTTYTATAAFNGKTYTGTTETPIASLGHEYGNPVFTWSSDYKTATVKLICKHDAGHVIEKDCDVTETPETATCDKAGKVLFTAEAIIGGITYTDSKETEVPALGHKYGNPVFTWSEDHKTATAARTCEYDSAHVETAGCTVTSDTVGATCTADGKTTYTATVEFGGKTYTDTDIVEIKAKGHTAVKDAAKVPTCTETGLTEGSHCSVCNEVIKKQEVIPATGHKYGEPEFSWDKDYSTAKAEFTCANDKNHVETVDAKVTSKTTDATCTADGKITYTATVKFGDKTYTDVQEDGIPKTGHTVVTDAAKAPTCTETGLTEGSHCSVCNEVIKKQEVIPATGHQYGEPEFTWSDDNTATVKVICTVDKHSETIEAKDVTYKTETVDATCDKAGKTIYTATVKVGDKTYTDTKTVEIPATGHSWSEWKEIQVPTATENGKKESTCTVCGIKRYENIPATGKPVEEDPTGGKLEKDVQVEKEAPVQEATMTNTGSDLLAADNIFDENEKKQINDGSVKAKVWMEISKTNEDEISSDIKKEVVKKAKEIMGNESDKITYFDADLFKQITDSDGNIMTDKTAITEPGRAINVTITIPESLRPTESTAARVYKLIRIHTDANGKESVDVLDGTFNEKTGEFSFATDKFSTYAILYSEVPVTVTIPTDKVDDKPLTSVGAKKQLKVDISPVSASSRQIKWTSSDLSVATVDENGIVTAVANGTATITATVGEGGPIADFTIKVEIPDDEPSENPSTPDKPSGDNKPTTGDSSNGGNSNAGNQLAQQPVAPSAKADTASNKDSKKADTTKKAGTKTGDNNTALPFVMLMFAGVGLASFGRKKKVNR